MDTLSDILRNMVPKLFVFFHLPVIYIGTDPVAKVCKTFVGENVKALLYLCPFLLYFHRWWTLTTCSVYQLNVRNSLLCSVIRRYTNFSKNSKEAKDKYLISFIFVCSMYCDMRQMRNGATHRCLIANIILLHQLSTPQMCTNSS